MSATAKMVQNGDFEFFGLVPKSPTHIGLICVKTLEPNLSLESL
jgi:hypothetical protein